MEGPSDESLDYIAPIVTNVTRQKAGRGLLLDPSRGFLRALASQLRSASVMRRRGCAAALRNVCYGAQVRFTRPERCGIETLEVHANVGARACNVAALLSTSQVWSVMDVQSV